MFDQFLHFAIFIVSMLFASGGVRLFKAQLLLEKRVLAKYSASQLLLMAVVPLAWIGYGVYAGVDTGILTIESFAVCFALLAFIMKLETPSQENMRLPGHGAPEGPWVKRIKYTLATLLGIALLVVAGIMFIGIVG